MGQSGPGSDGNEGVLHIPQSSSIAGSLPSDFLVSYPGHSLEGSYPSAEKQSVYSTAPADWAILTLKAPQGSGDVLFNSLETIADLYLFWSLGLIKC